MDAKFHYLLFFQQQARIKAEKLQHVYDMQLRRVPTLVLTQMKGLSVDFEANRLLSGKFLDKIEQSMNSIKATPEYIRFREIAGHDMNPGSTHDVERLLKEVIKARSSAKTATGRYSTDEDALALIDNPIAQMILDYRKAVKSNSTYIEPYNPDNPKTVVHDDGLVHTILNSIFTTTGRLSSDSPNMQNISKRDSELAEVRSQFVIGDK
jgi:DNA polymerase-1